MIRFGTLGLSAFKRRDVLRDKIKLIPKKTERNQLTLMLKCIINFQTNAISRQ